MEFVGRQGDLARLRRERERVGPNTGRFIWMTGRRRVGKSRLVQEFVEREGLPYVFFEAPRRALSEALRRFGEAVASSTLPSSELARGATFSDWPTALRVAAQQASAERPSVIVIDELPDLLEHDPDADADIRAGWSVLEGMPVMLFCIGSDISMMEQLMDHDRALFGRPTLQIRIPPLSPGDIAQLLALDAGDAFDAYLTIGGFPMLAADWGARMTRKRFLARELIDPSSNLIVNGERILAAEFRSETQAREVLEAIGKGERRFEEIRRRTSLQPASLSRSLELLVQGKGVVERLTPYAAPLPRRDPRYLIADPYLRFWLRFVAPYMQEIERGRGDEAVARVIRDWSVYRGAAIEPVVRAAIERMLPNDRFGDARRVGGWWDRTGRQLDLVGLPEGGGPARVSFVGSIKWRERAPFDGNDLRALEAALTLVPGVDASTLLVGVSRSGFDASSSRLDVRLEPEELLRAWNR
ncbi:MAG: ATP-binding protein [Solirubrobacteraceae bacterium]